VRQHLVQQRHAFLRQHLHGCFGLVRRGERHDVLGDGQVLRLERAQFLQHLALLGARGGRVGHDRRQALQPAVDLALRGPDEFDVALLRGRAFHQRQIARGNGALADGRLHVVQLVQLARAHLGRKGDAVREVRHLVQADAGNDELKQQQQRKPQSQTGADFEIREIEHAVNSKVWRDLFRSSAALLRATPPEKGGMGKPSNMGCPRRAR